MLNTAMVSMMAVVMTVREIRGQGRLAMMPDDFKSHRREAEAFLLHCWRRTRKKHVAISCTSSSFLTVLKTARCTNVLHRLNK